MSADKQGQGLFLFYADAAQWADFLLEFFETVLQ